MDKISFNYAFSRTHSHFYWSREVMGALPTHTPCSRWAEWCRECWFPWHSPASCSIWVTAQMGGPLLMSCKMPSFESPNHPKFWQMAPVFCIRLSTVCWQSVFLFLQKIIPNFIENSTTLSIWGFFLYSKFARDLRVIFLRLSWFDLKFWWRLFVTSKSWSAHESLERTTDLQEFCCSFSKMLCLKIWNIQGCASWGH